MVRCIASRQIALITTTLLVTAVFGLTGTNLPGKLEAAGPSSQPVGAGGGAAAASMVYNVRDLGAVGDGIADDTRSIQLALDKVGNTGGVVVFPPGRYRVASRHRLQGKYSALLLSAVTTPPLPIKLIGDGATLAHDAGDVTLLCVGDSAHPYAIDGF